MKVGTSASAPEGTSGVGVLTGAAVVAGTSPSVQGVEAAGTSEASGVSMGASGASVGTISEEQGVLEDSGPMVGLGITVLSVKAGASDATKLSLTGRVNVAEGAGWSMPVLMAGTWELTSVGMEAEYSP